MSRFWLIFFSFLTLSLAGVLSRKDEDIFQKLVHAVSKKPVDASGKCAVCTLIVDGFQMLLKENSTDEELINFGVNLCKILKAENTHVCDTLVPSLLPEVIFMLDKIVVTPNELCGAFVADCGNSTNVFDVLWPLKIPDGKPAVKPWPQVPKGNPTMRVLHLSDIHIDRQYVEGAEALCDNEIEDDVGIFRMFVMCCRNYPPEFFGNKVKDSIKMPAGKWGTLAQCDLPYQTFISAMKHISQNEKLDYIMITGDLEAHNIGDYTRESTSASIENITNVIREFFPNTPIYQSIGNHEGVPSDSFAPHGMDEYDTRGPQWLYTELVKDWSPELGAVQQNDVQYRGSWAQYIKPSLKLISINSIYCSNHNFYIYINQVDPDQTLEWLIEQLIDSEQKGDKVHLFAHIPSGVNDCLKGWSYNFYDIVNRFESTIVAQFYGHTHLDHFQIYYESADAKKRPTGINFITPSLTTNSNLNPAYRIYTIDGDYQGSSFTILEMETYSANITEANINNHEPLWKLEYKTTESYSMKDLSPASWHELTVRFENDPDLFRKFYNFYTRNGNQSDNCPNEKGCREGFVCGMRTARSHNEAPIC
ncbi:unnamed protein product, partial [Mesorhabditis belari]|uniref:Sphingomyelin phosphodiesterase n=1 Tax=Mesorhabditis belari TaxID=2138241 RepID=A0AAF3EPU3_9BILA